MSNIRYSPSTGRYFQVDENNQLREINAAAAELADSPMQAGLVAMGKTFTDLGRGAQQLYHNVLGNDQAVADLQQTARDEEAAYGDLTRVSPKATMVGEAIPHLATAPLPGGLGLQALYGAGMNALDYDPESSMTERGVTGAITTIGGNVAARVLADVASATGRAFTGPRNVTGRATGTVGVTRTADELDELAGSVSDDVAAGLSDTEARLLARSEELGMRSPPGVQAGDTTQRLMEASNRSNPMAGAQLRAIGNINQKGLNENVIEEFADFGVTGNKLNDSQLAKISDGFKSRYASIANRIGKVGIDDDTIDALAAFEQKVDANRNLLPDTSSRIRKAAGDILDRADDNMELDAKQLMAYRSNAQKAAKQAWRQGDELSGELYDEIGAIMDDVLERGATGGELRELRQLGPKWRLFKAVESNGVDQVSGNLRPLQMNRNLTRMDKGGYYRGRNQSKAYDAVRYAYMNKDISPPTGARLAPQITGNGLLDFALNASVDPLARATLNMSPANSALGRYSGAGLRGLLLD